MSLPAAKGYTAHSDKCPKDIPRRISLIVGDMDAHPGDVMDARPVLPISHSVMDNVVSLEGTPKIKIVIVEKHAAVRRALRKRLSATSHLDVIAAIQEPAEALAFLNAPGVPNNCGSFADVVLLGLQNETDDELFKTIETVKRLSHYSAAIIVLAPFADEVERHLMEQAGVASYLLKYIDSPGLIREIEAAAVRRSTSVSRSI